MPCSYAFLPSKNNPCLPFWLYGHWKFTFIHQHLRSPNPSQGDFPGCSLTGPDCSSLSIPTYLHIRLFKDILPTEVQGTIRTSLSCMTALNKGLLLSLSYICCNCSSPS